MNKFQGSRVLPFIVPLLLAAEAHAEQNLPSNFVLCECICGNYDSFSYECIVTVPTLHVSHYLEKIAPLSLRVGAAVSFRSACQNPAACGTINILRTTVPQLPLKGFVAVKLMESHPYGPIPVGTTFKLIGSAYEPLLDRLYLAK